MGYTRKTTIIGATVLIGIAAIVPLRSALSAQQESSLIYSPPHWVAYTVEKELVSAGGAGETSTVFEYRGSDGSTMSVQHFLANPDLIAITNASTRLHYFFNGDRWVSSPARQPRSPRTALDARTVTLVSPDDERIAALSGLDVHVYEHRNPSTGTINLLCPELNMLAVWSQDARGFRERVKQIVLGEPAVKFAPPDDAKIEARNAPQGPGGLDRLPSQGGAERPLRKE